MSDTRKACWHLLPEPIKQQAVARWASGARAAGPGDGYLYRFRMVPEAVHQLDLLPISPPDGHVYLVPRLIGRRIDPRSRAGAVERLAWSRAAL